MDFPEKADEPRDKDQSETNEKPESKYDRSIIEGSLGRSVWKIAAPTILANIFGGMQGLVDHIVVGNVVGKFGNAAIGVSWQIFLVVIVFISSIFTGMSILVSRFAGAGEVNKVNRTVYQAFITAVFLALGVFAPVGYFAAPYLLDIVNAEPGVQAEALPYLRVMFVFGVGMMIFFMLAGALRSAGDAKTPMILGIVMTILNASLSIVLISGVGPVPSFGTKGAAMGTCISAGVIALYSIRMLWSGKWVVTIRNDRGYAPDFTVIKQLFKFGLPAGFQGIAMNVGGVLLLSYVGSLAQSAAAQAAYSIAYGQLFSLVTWTSVGLMGAAAVIAGQNLGAKNPERANSAVHTAAKFAFAGASFVGFFYFFVPAQLLAIFGMTEPEVVGIGVQLLRVLSISGIFVSLALTYTGGLQGTGDTKSPLYISIISQVFIPLGICFTISQFGTLEPLHIWLAILAGHFTRCALSLIRFRQGKWRDIKVDIQTTHG